MTVSSHPAPPSKTIGLMGTPLASGNRGVLALGAALARLCLDNSPSAEVVYFGSHRDARPVLMRPHGSDYSLRVVHWRLTFGDGLRHHLLVIVIGAFVYRWSPLSLLRRWLAATIPWIGELERAALVGDVRGGDSFSDIYGVKRFLIATLPILSVLWIKRSIVLFPQTYGPFKSRTARWIASRIIQRASMIIARDKDSQRVAQQLAAPGQEVLLSPDVAFSLYADIMGSALFDGEATPQPIPENAIGLNINGLMYNGGYTGKNMFGLKLDYRRFVTELVIELLRNQPRSIVLVPHTYAPAGDVESDNEACRLVKESVPADLQARVRIVTGEYDAHQLKGIIAQCYFFIGSRMHSCIAALSQGVPCVGVAYSMKFRGVFETVGLTDWVLDGRSMNSSETISRILELLTDCHHVRDDLRQQSRLAQNQLQQVFSRICRLE